MKIKNKICIVLFLCLSINTFAQNKVINLSYGLTNKIGIGYTKIDNQNELFANNIQLDISFKKELKLIKLNYGIGIQNQNQHGNWESKEIQTGGIIPETIECINLEDCENKFNFYKIFALIGVEKSFHKLTLGMMLVPNYILFANFKEHDFKETYDFKSNTDQIKKWNIGLNTQVGYPLFKINTHQINFNIFYNLHLLSDRTLKTNTLRHYQTGIGIGYQF